MEPFLIDWASNSLGPERGPLQGPGVPRRLLPYFAGAVAAYVFAILDTVGPPSSNWEMVVVGIAIPLLFLAVLLVPWERIPLWTQAIPPLIAMLLVALVRNETGGSESYFTVLFAVPVALSCVYGTRRQLLWTLVLLGILLLGPIALIGGPEYPNSDYATSGWKLAVAIGLAVGVQRLIEGDRGRAAEWRQILSAAHDSVFTVDQEGLIVEWNPQAEKDFGWSRDEIIGQSFIDRIIPEQDRQTYLRWMLIYIRREHGPHLDSGMIRTGLRKDGSTFPIDVSLTRIVTPKGINFSAFIRDITERETAARSLAEAEERFRRAFDDAPIGMALISLDGEMFRVNRALAELSGHEIGELTGTLVIDHVHPDDRASFRRTAGELLAAEAGAGYIESEERFIHSDGRTIWTHFGASLIRDANGTALYAIVQMQDISERRRTEEALAHQAAHDHLTDLPNRGLLADRMDVALARLRRSGEPIAILFLDLDRFKRINDTFGHDAGDRVLLEVAARLRGVVRPSDTVARMGGDEFAILCEGMTQAAAEALSNRIADVLSDPFEVEGRELGMSASIGIVINTDAEAEPTSLLTDADTAMYESKDRGRSGHFIFVDEMRDKARARLQLESELRAGLRSGEVVVHYQLQVDLSSGEAIGVEALARWNHPERGLMRAAEFMPIAEESDLVIEVGDLILREAVHQTMLWRDAGAQDLSITVNVSGRQLAGNQLAELITDQLRRSRLPAAALCIEVTESAVVGDPDAAIEGMRKLGELGVSFAIHEFGIGTSTLELIRGLPGIERLKIDKAFVAGMGDDSARHAVVGVIVDLANALDLIAIAEGVETAGQVKALRELGCRGAQGHYLGGPSPAEEIEEILMLGVVVSPQSALRRLRL